MEITVSHIPSPEELTELQRPQLEALARACELAIALQSFNDVNEREGNADLRVLARAGRSQA